MTVCRTLFGLSRSSGPNPTLLPQPMTPRDWARPSQEGQKAAKKHQLLEAEKPCLDRSAEQNSQAPSRQPSMTMMPCGAGSC